MRWMWAAVLGLGFASAARSEDIVDVLRRSQQQRLEALAPAPVDGARAEVVRRSFAALLSVQPELPAIELRVIRGPLLAETVHGHIVLANETLADLPEDERLFVLAHELGHVARGHWLQMALLFQKWVPGEVTPEHTDAVAGLLGRDASGLAHQHEFEADAYALEVLQRLGLGAQTAVSLFRRLGSLPDTATHPSTRKRVALLRTPDTAP